MAPISIPVASHEPGSETTMRPIVTVSGSSPDEKRPARSRSRPGPIAIGSMGRPSETPSEDAPDSPVFELEQPVRPSPVLKKFVHAIEVGQAIWELAHPSVVQLRRDEEFEEAREEKAELRAGVYIGLEVNLLPTTKILR